MEIFVLFVAVLLAEPDTAEPLFDVLCTPQCTHPSNQISPRAAVKILTLTHELIMKSGTIKHNG